jgi:hypothetical protein
MSDWPRETPEYWNEVSSMVGSEPPSETFKTDWVAKKVPLYSRKMTSFDVGYLIDVMDFIERDKRQWRFVEALRERMKGHTPDSYGESVFSPSRWLDKVSVWTIKSFHHWMMFEKLSGHNINEYDHIIEIGAGIGESARMAVDAFGFKGRYTIVDLPTIIQFSRKNLEDYAVFEYVEDLKQLQPSLSKPLVFSTWGLSETPLDFRDQLFDSVRYCDLFVAFQAKIFGIDNREYFIQHWPTMYNKNIKIKDIPMHTVDGGNFYLFAD